MIVTYNDHGNKVIIKDVPSVNTTDDYGYDEERDQEVSCTLLWFPDPITKHWHQFPLEDLVSITDDNYIEPEPIKSTYRREDDVDENGNVIW